MLNALEWDIYKYRHLQKEFKNLDALNKITSLFFNQNL